MLHMNGSSVLKIGPISGKMVQVGRKWSPAWVNGKFLPPPPFAVGPGFRNHTFRVTTKIYPPFTQKSRHPNGTEFYEGFCIDILEELARTLQFRYEIKEPPDGFWGVYNSTTDTWDGMVGMLQKRVSLASFPSWRCYGRGFQKCLS